MMRFVYNLLMPIGFLFFVPGLLYKLRNRGGWKSTFKERFGVFTFERKEELKAFHGAIWIHAVSVGETVLALGMIRRYLERFPQRKFVLSTTTTTGQELARTKCPENTAVIFCPIDFPAMVKRTFQVVKPSMFVIFETEIWPNLIHESKRNGIPVALVNGRMSDKSAKGYRRARLFFAPLLSKFDRILVQSDADFARYKSVAPLAAVECSGNMKFDQKVPADLPDPQLENYFGAGEHPVLLAASTHSGEEEVVTESFCALKQEIPDLKLILVPRHAERGGDIASMLKKKGVTFVRKSVCASAAEPVDVLLADTTGEMLKLMSRADVVIMGKSLAGHDEGHNLLEPALLSKAIVTGHVLRNFRFILETLVRADALVAIAQDSDLTPRLRELFSDPAMRTELGRRAYEVVMRNCGATDRTIDALESLL